MKKSSIVNDAELWKKIKAGNKSALGPLYNLYAKILYNYGNKLCHNPSQVEDAIHDVFVDLWRFHKNLADVNSVRLYLLSSLRNRILKQLQGSSLYTLAWAEISLETPSNESILIENEIKDEQLKKLRSNLINLSPRQYEAIMLRFYENLSYAEIGTMMEVNEQSVRNLIQRGLEHLRQHAKIVLSIVSLLLSIIITLD